MSACEMLYDWLGDYLETSYLAVSQLGSGSSTFLNLAFLSAPLIGLLGRSEMRHSKCLVQNPAHVIVCTEW